MVLILPILLITISYVIGSLPMKLLSPKENTLGESCLVGTLFMLCLWEGMMLVGMKMTLSFSMLCKIYTMILLAFFLVSSVFARKHITGGVSITNLKLLVPLGVMIVVILLETLYIWNIYPDLTGDHTIETVNTTLASDAIYETNPYTGLPLVAGMSFRGKLVTLPLFFAYLAKISRLQSSLVVYALVPIWVLLLSVVFFGRLARLLFPEKEKEPILFLLGLGLLNLFGVFSKNCLFYYQMRRGFRGETFLISVLLPALLFSMLQYLRDQDKKSISFVVLILISSIAVIDITKGLLVLLYALLVTILVGCGYKVQKVIRRKSVDKN